MAIVVGKSFGDFEILARVGAGGMGEVYQARDRRLGRTVALKFLTRPAADRPDRLERLRREASAISRLNHPHICTLYDIGERDGVTFLVMEYIRGETLADRISRGRLRLEESLCYGAQMADALDAAHREGIVHRDFKPSNVIVTRDGVKLLDFGLAKLRESEPDPDGASPTVSLQLTEDGLALGTLPYMAPEQLEGKQIDARADLFALGAVLYEMASGRPPFQGNSKASLITAIMSADPEPLSVRQPLTPPLFEHAVRRCLAKDSGDRWQTARDLCAELKWISESLPRSNGAAPAAHRRRRRPFAMIGILIVVATAVITAAIAMRSPRPPSPAFHRLTYRRGTVTSARFAPDGQTIVYSAAWEGQPHELFLTRQDSKESRSLGIAKSRLLGISSTGEMALLFGPQSMWRAFGTLARAPLAGGVPRELLENVIDADWSPDASQLAVIRSSPEAPGKLQVEFPVGTKVYESTRQLGWLRISPRGDRVAFIERLPNGGDVIVIDRSGAKTTPAGPVEPLVSLGWSPTGTEIWYSGGFAGRGSGLRAVSLSGKQRLIAETPDLLFLHDVFRDGRMLATRLEGREGFACRAPGETSDRDLSWFDGSALAALSVDGRTAVFAEMRQAEAPTMGIYLRGTDGSAAIRLGDGVPEDLSPDGKWVLARPTRSEYGFVRLPTGAGSPRLLSRGSLVALNEANFSPDGTRVFFGGREQGRGARIYVQDLEGGEPRAVSPEGVRTDGLSTPDGLFVEGSSVNGHALYPVDGGQPRLLPFLSSNETPVQWPPDGRTLYVARASTWPGIALLTFSSAPAVIDRVDVATGRRETWKTIAPPDQVGLEAISTVRITPDGNTYCYRYTKSLSDLFVIDGVK